MNEAFLTIVNMSISASWIVLAILILRLLLKKAPKWIIVLLWSIVAVRLICPFSFESVLSLIPSTQTINPEVALNSPVIDSGVTIIDDVVNPIISEATISIQAEKEINIFQFIMPYLAGFWLVGIFALLIYTLVSFSRLKSKIGTAVLLRDNIYQSESVASPFVLGIIKPKIYLPFNMNEQDMEHVIAHEQAHLRRKDHWWKPIGFLILTLHWFNPMVWVGYILLCRDIELACDEKVVKNLNNEQRADYSQALLSCSIKRRMITACPVAFGEVGVKNRVKSVLNYKKPAFWMIILSFVLLVAVAVCFLTNPDGNSSSIGIIGGADGPTSIIVSGKKNIIDKILSEDGYEISSLEEKKISFLFNSKVITDKMFKQDKVYKVHSSDTLNDCIEFTLKEVLSSGEQFVFTFDVSYTDIPEKGTVYLINANQFDGGLELGDKITVSDPFGVANSDGPYYSYCSSKSSDEFSFSVPKAWFENRRDNKIVVEIDALEIAFRKSGLTDKNNEQNYTYATSKTGAFYRIRDNYYYAVIDETSEYHEVGLYLFEPDADKRFICNLGVFFNSITAENTFYYIKDDYKLYAVDLKEVTQPRVIGEELYLPDNNYSIEKIISASQGFIYCEAKHRGVRETYPDWDLVYLKIDTKTDEISEIEKDKIPQQDNEMLEITNLYESTTGYYEKPTTTSQISEPTNSEIYEVSPPKTTAFADYFTPDGERVTEYVGG